MVSTDPMLKTAVSKSIMTENVLIKLGKDGTIRGDPIR
jgi:hypothetical protein